MFKYCRPSTRVHQTWIQSTTKYGVDSGFRLPDCDTGCRRTEFAVSDCCLRRHKFNTVWSTKLLISGSVSVAKGRHAEHFLCWIFGFFTNLLNFFYRCPINSVVPPYPRCQKFGGGARAPAMLYGAYGVKSHCKIGIERNTKKFYFVRERNGCVSYSDAFKIRHRFKPLWCAKENGDWLRWVKGHADFAELGLQRCQVWLKCTNVIVMVRRQSHIQLRLRIAADRLCEWAIVEMCEVYIEKSNGPRTDPWGTPIVHQLGGDECEPMRTDWVLTPTGQIWMDPRMYITSNAKAIAESFK